MWVGICRCWQSFSRICSICTNWLNTRTFCPSASKGSSNSNSVSVLPDGESLPTRSGWQQILAQPGERGEHVDFAFRHAFFGHRLHDLLAAATQFGQVEFPLVFTQFAIATFLDPVGQILSDLAFEPAQHQRPEFRSQPAARDLLGPGRVLAAARFVRFVEMALRTEIAWLDEI